MPITKWASTARVRSFTSREPRGGSRPSAFSRVRFSEHLGEQRCRVLGARDNVKVVADGESASELARAAITMAETSRTGPCEFAQPHVPDGEIVKGIEVIELLDAW